MDDNNSKEGITLTKEERKKRSKERDKVAVIEHTIFAYCSNREVEKEEVAEKGEEKDNKKKSKRGWPTRGL